MSAVAARGTNMLAWLGRIIRRLFSLFLVTGFVRKRAPGSFRGGWGPRHPPRDPYSRTREPKPRRPPGGRAAVAVDEPDDDETLDVVAGSRRDRRAT